MSEKESKHVTSSKDGSSINKNLVWGGLAVVIFIALANNNSDSSDTSPESLTPTGHVSASSCVSKVHSAAQYDRSRLKPAGQSASSVNINYRNDSGRVHKFRCVGPSGTVQLFAQGAGMWMDM